jgi:hypothetical protein
MYVFDIQPISTKPPEACHLIAIWSYHQKRSPISKILKHKLRLCVDGSQQEYGHDYWDAYTPVISWQTIRYFFCYQPY